MTTVSGPSVRQSLPRAPRRTAIGAIIGAPESDSGGDGRLHSEAADWAIAGPGGLDQQTFPTHKIAALADALSEEGVEPLQILPNTGFARIEDLYDPNARVSYRQMIAAFENAMRLPVAAGLAMRLGKRVRVTGTGLYGYALLSSSTGREASAFCLRYYRVLGPVCSMSIDEDSHSVSWSFEPILSPDPGAELYRFCAEAHSVITANLLVDILGPRLRLRSVHFCYPAPAHAEYYNAAFGCPVSFDQPRNEIVHSPHWLDQPLEYADRITHALTRQLCQEMLADVTAREGSTGKVYAALLRHPGRTPALDEIAAELGLGERALRRRLSQEGNSFHQIVAEVRRQLAIRYLRQTTMTIEEIADRLGYSDAANFRHAFRRWTNQPPSAFRQQSHRRREFPEPPTGLDEER